LRPNLDKPFYIQDPEAGTKIAVESRACFFNDLDWHAGGRTNVQSYSMRVDGVFSDVFRESIGIAHLENY
jgi:hypothetical protein